MAPNFEKLINDVGEVKGILQQLVPEVKRALNNQEEAFRRLGEAEKILVKHNEQIGTVEKGLDEAKKVSSRISSLFAVGITIGLNLLKIIFWKDQ